MRPCGARFPGMLPAMRATLLGTGTSTGVPAIGCDCAVCRSEDPRDKRLRTSCLLEWADGTKIIIDASMDCRQQMLGVGLRRLDAVLLTHAHADHAVGLDELLRGVDVLIINALPDEPHPTHQPLAQCVAVSEDVAPGRAFITHVGHWLSAADSDARTPANVSSAHDGMTFELE